MPISQTVINAIESTQNVPSSRRVRIVDDNIAYLDPDSAPLTVILMKESSSSVDGWQFEWLEKELSARWDAVNNGAGYASGATSIVVDTGAFFLAGDIVNVVRTGEKMLVTAVATNTLTVVRGYGTTSAAALLDNDDLQIIGNSFLEGTTSGTPRTVGEVYQSNYTQILRTPFGETRTMQNTKNYGGVGRTRLRKENGVYHKIDIERTGLFGEKLLDTNVSGSGSSTGNPRRTTGGLVYFLTGLSSTAKIKDFNGLVSEGEVEDWMGDVFLATGSGNTRTAFASTLWCSIFDQIAMGRLRVVDKAETYGVTVLQYISSHGTFNIVKHRLLENSPVPAGVTGGPFGYAGSIFALDMKQLEYRTLANSMTQLHENVQAPDYDGYKDEWLTECGWVIKLAKVHGYGKNATG